MLYNICKNHQKILILRCFYDVEGKVHKGGRAALIKGPGGKRRRHLAAKKAAKLILGSIECQKVLGVFFISACTLLLYSMYSCLMASFKKRNHHTQFSLFYRLCGMMWSVSPRASGVPTAFGIFHTSALGGRNTTAILSYLFSLDHVPHSAPEWTWHA